MGSRRLVTAAFALLPIIGMPIRAAAGEQIEIPEWKLKLVLAYPIRGERASMLLSALKEHCDLDAIQGVDAEDLLRDHILPAMLLGQIDLATVKPKLQKVIRSLHCAGKENSVAPSPTLEHATIPVAESLLPKSTQVLAQAAPRSSATVSKASSSPIKSVAVQSSTDDRLAKAEESAIAAAAELKQGSSAVVHLATCLKSNKPICKDVADPKHADSPSCDALPAQRICQGSLAELSDQQHQRNLASYQTIKAANDSAQQLDKGSSHAQIVKSLLDAAGPDIGRSANANLSRVAQYGIYAGPSYSLAGDGTWKAGGEFLVRFDNEAVAPTDDRAQSKICLPVFTWCRGYAELEYRSVAALDKSKSTASAPFDPFAQSGGFFRFNGGWRMHFTDWLGAEVGLGLSSLPNGGGDQTRLKVRETAGLQMQTLFNDGSLGQLFIGASHDKFWTRSVLNDPAKPDMGSHLERNRSRWIMDGIVMIPGFDLSGWKMAGRVSADAPTDGRGPSDVRASLLLYFPLNDWIQSNLPKKADSTK